MKYILYTYTSVFFKRVYFEHLDSWTRIRGPKRTQTHTHTHRVTQMLMEFGSDASFFCWSNDDVPSWNLGRFLQGRCMMWRILLMHQTQIFHGNIPRLNFVSLHVCLDKLGGGNSNIFCFHPYLFGEMIQFDLYFSNGFVQPPTSKLLCKYLSFKGRCIILLRVSDAYEEYSSL